MAPTNRFTGKSAALAAAYGMGTNRIMGNNPTQFWMDDLGSLSAADQAWADAFGEVLGVGPNFYIKANRARKTWLENHYRELATHDTPKGRKAAKVVARVVAWQLAPSGPQLLGVDFAHDEIQVNIKTGVRPFGMSSVNRQMEVYRHLFGKLTP